MLCDGLDEVNTQAGARDRVIRDLVNFSNKYDDSQMLITCRVAASEYKFEAFTPVEMADFDKKQIHTFITNWFSHSQSGAAIANRLEMQSSQKIAEQFLQEFEQSHNPRLYDLARTPLILTLLCLAYEETLEFPDRRSEIYEEAFNTLLRKWDSKRNIKRDAIYHKLTLGRKRQMFARIAAETFEDNTYLFQQKHLEQKIISYLQKLPPADSSEDIDGEAVLRAIEAQHGIFVERSKGYYSFSHLTFQEYFTARYIAENSHKGTLQGLIYSHCLHDNWREVFLLTAEMLDDADEFFTIFLAKLDEMVREDERLIQLLTTIEQEATGWQTEGTRLEKRGAILIFMLDIAYSVTLASAYDLAYDCDYAHARDLDRDRVLARERAYTNTYNRARFLGHAYTYARDSVLDRDRDRDLDSVLDRDRDLARASASILGHAYAYARARARSDAYARGDTSDLDRAKEFSERQGLIDLYNALNAISVPSENDAPETWSTFSHVLFGVFQTHFALEDYEYTVEQAEHVMHYLEATVLLLDCLENAYVSDREAIMDRLLRVPTSMDPE